MTETDTAIPAEATTQVDALAAELNNQGFVTTASTAGRYVRLSVVNKAASQLAEDVYATPTADGSWWFWWSWAERLCPITDVVTAAQAIARVLRVADAGQ